LQGHKAWGIDLSSFDNSLFSWYIFLGSSKAHVVIKVEIRRQRKKIQMQGVQILRNEAYIEVRCAVTKDEAQRSPSALLRAVSMSNGRWTFYEAVKEKASMPMNSAREIQRNRQVNETNGHFERDCRRE
jgi:hypothetical protein